MKTPYVLPALLAITLALTACGGDKDGQYTNLGPDGNVLPSGDQLNMDGGGLPPSRPAGDFDPNKDVNYQTLAADTIYFAYDSTTVPGAERGKLQQVAEWLKANPGHSLFLAGHADKRGTPEYNRALGERRALAVREYLAGLGLPPAVLFTNSYGADRPAVDGDTEEAYARNRRVEIGVIVKK